MLCQTPYPTARGDFKTTEEPRVHSWDKQIKRELKMSESTERKQRMMHWTCRKCSHKWDTRIPMEQNSMFQDDAHEKTICDKCIDEMGQR